MYETIPGALPFQQNVTVKDPANTGVLNRPDAIHQQLPLDVFPQVPSEPIRKGDYWSEGKPIEHAWSHGRRDLFLNIAGFLAVDAWTGEVQRVAKYIRSNIVRTPLGMQHAFVERVNIERAPSAPYGSAYAIVDPSDATIFDVRGYRTRR